MAGSGEDTHPKTVPAASAGTGESPAEPMPAHPDVHDPDHAATAPGGDGAGDEDGGDGGGASPIELPGVIAPMGHAELASQDTGDDAAYALHPSVAWMRSATAAATLRTEETLVLKAMRR